MTQHQETITREDIEQVRLYLCALSMHIRLPINALCDLALKGIEAQAEANEAQVMPSPTQDTGAEPELIEQIKTLASNVGLRFVPDPEKVKAFPFDKPTPDSEVEGLIARLQKWGFPNQTSLDGDLMEAATSLRRLKDERDEYRQSLNKLGEIHDAVLAHRDDIASQLSEAQAENVKLREGIQQAFRYMDGDYNADPAVVDVLRAVLSHSGGDQK